MLSAGRDRSDVCAQSLQREGEAPALDVELEVPIVREARDQLRDLLLVPQALEDERRAPRPSHVRMQPFGADLSRMNNSRSRGTLTLARKPTVRYRC